MQTDISNTIFQEIWTQAFKTYQEQTGRNLQNDSILQKLRSIEDLLDEIDSRNKTFESFRNRHRKLWTALSSCLKPLDLLGNTLQSAVSSAPFAPAVFAGVLYLVTACNNVSDSYDYLEKLFLELKEYMDRLEEYLKGGMSTSLKKKSIVTLSILLEIIGLSEKMVRTGRFKQFLGAVVFGNEKMKSALERLKNQIDSEERLVIAATYSSTQQTAQAAGRTEQKVEALTKSNEEVRALQKITRDEEKKEAEDKTIRNLLYSPANDKVEDIYTQMEATIVPGSGKWILDEPLFHAWINRRTPILWIFGKPGAGKSFLATRIISELRIRYPQDVGHPSSVSMAYFYVKEDDLHLQNLNTILRSIAYQITRVNPIYRKHVLSSDKSVNSSTNAWKNLFMEFFGSKSNFEYSVFVIIDGLDEAPIETRYQLSEFLHSIIDHASAASRPRIQFAVSGRPELRDDFRFARRENSIYISSQKNHDDIAKYITRGLKKVRILYKMERTAMKKLMKDIHDSILKGSDGMFLWAKLILDQISEKERESEIREALDSAPRELDGMIGRVFERLENDLAFNHQDLNKILAWVYCARRPLLLGEVDVILRIPSGEANLVLRDRLRGKFASILSLAGLEGYDGKNEEPEPALTEQLPNIDQLDEFDDVFTIVDAKSTVKSESSTRNDDGLLPDTRLKKELEATRVVFVHKSIYDYITNSKFRISASKPHAIGVDINKSEVDITTTLLSIICDNITKDYKEFDLVSYAAENFMKHLGDIRLSHTEDSDKQMILELLYRLFHEEERLRALLKAAEKPDEERMSDRGYKRFFHTWIVTSKYTQVVRRWFRKVDEIKVSIFESSELEWIRKAGLSAKELLRPLALLCAHLWQAETGPEDPRYLWLRDSNTPNTSQACVWLLHGYLKMNDEGETPNCFSRIRLFETGLDWIRPEEMKELAEFGNIEKTEHWHTSLAWIMVNGGHFGSAMEHFHSALELDATLWIAMEGLARCFGSLHRYEEAISWMHNALESLPSSLHFLANHFWSRISGWKLKLGDMDGAIDAAKNEYALDTGNFDSIFKYLDLLHRGRRSQPIIDLTKDLSQRESPNFTKSLLIQLISSAWNISEYVGLAAVTTGSKEILEIMRDAIDDAVIAADMDNRWWSVLVRVYGANFNYRYLNRVDVAMVYWEVALQTIISNFNDPLSYKSAKKRSNCIAYLSVVYFNKAVEANKAGEDYGHWIEKLQSLAKLTESLQPGREILVRYGTGYPSHLYGIWLREYGQAEESAWKDCFRSSILSSIALLSDEDPNNVWLGYSSLAGTLLHAGDIERGTSVLFIALLSLESDMLKSPQQRESTGGDSKASIQKTETFGVSNNISKRGTTARELPRVKLSDFGFYSYYCDGTCTTECRSYRELHFCRICDDICFCEQCIHLIKANKLPYRHCSPDHEWIQAYPIPKDTNNFAAATIRDGYVEVNEQWLTKLREEWAK